MIIPEAYNWEIGVPKDFDYRNIFGIYLNMAFVFGFPTEKIFNKDDFHNCKHLIPIKINQFVKVIDFPKISPIPEELKDSNKFIYSSSFSNIEKIRVYYVEEI